MADMRFYRSHRSTVTASRFHAILAARSELRRLTLATDYHTPPTQRGPVPEACRFGIAHESAAIAKYVAQLGGRRVARPALMLSLDHQELGATPDALLTDAQGRVEMVEVKCIFSTSPLSVSDAVRQRRGFYLREPSPGRFELRPTHPHYTQVGLS